MKVLVLQLCRLGDLIQTFPMLAGLEREGHQAHVLIQEAFRDVPIPDDTVSEVHLFPDLRPERAELSETLARVEALSALIRGLRARRFDLIVNLSHDVESAWLATLVGAPGVRGLVASRNRELSLRDPWMEYLFSHMSNRRLGAFNLADVYARVAGVEKLADPRIVASPEARSKARTLLGEKTGSRPWVGIVPGASDSRKRYRPASFAAVSRALAAAGARVVLLGAPDETALAESIERLAPGAVTNLSGRTSLPELAAVLAELDLVITNDTGTMHFAAATGVKTLTVTLGPAFVNESAPYGEGHVVVQPDLHCHPCDFSSYCADVPCHDVVSPEAVFELAGAILTGRKPNDALFAGVSVFRTAFDDEGRLSIVPWVRRPAGVDDVLRFAYRELWETSLGGPRSRTIHELRAELDRHWNLEDSFSARERAAEVAAAASRLIQILDGASENLLSCLRKPGECALSGGETLERLTREIDLLGRIVPGLRPLTAHTLMKLQLAGSRSRESVVTDTLRAITGASNRARVFQGLVSTLGRALEPELAFVG